ncbi:unnamed protein product, partial [Trichobilharzia szidati]
CNVWCEMAVYSQVAKNLSVDWNGYAVVGCLVLIVLLGMLLFYKFRNNLPVALMLIRIIIVLWSTSIIFLCCDFKQGNWYILLVFIILEDLLTIIFCYFIRRFKQRVMLFLLSLSTVCVITGIVLFFVANGKVALVFASSLK